MGIFSKVWKSVKKGFKGAFKGISKGIKSAFKKFGKFMGKIGIVGQLAMMFVLPGVGGALMGKLGAGIGSGFGKLTGALAKGGKIAQAAGKVLEAGASFAKAGHSAFKTVTEGIGNFVGEFSKTALKKIPGMTKLAPSLTSASDTFFTKSSVLVDGKMVSKSAWSAVQDSVVANASNVTANFQAGLKNLGGAGKVFTASGANTVAASKAIVGAGGANIPSATAESSSLLGDPSAVNSVGPLKEGYQLPGTTAPSGVTNIGDIKGAVTNVNTDKGFFESFGSGAGGSTTTPTKVFTKAGYDASGMRISNKSLLSKAGDFVTGLPGEAVDYAKEEYTKFLDGRSLGRAVAEETGDKAVDMVTETLERDVKTRLSQEAGIVKVPEAPESYGTYVAGYEAAGIQDYGSAQINDRAMQMSLNPQAFLQQNPYGHGANIYQQQMNVKYGGTA
tara:strand:- start:3122 stop:4459 length:1338 start_codon:yes stop_codon:yes gene_type:complete